MPLRAADLVLTVGDTRGIGWYIHRLSMISFWIIHSPTRFDFRRPLSPNPRIHSLEYHSQRFFSERGFR